MWRTNACTQCYARKHTVRTDKFSIEHTSVGLAHPRQLNIHESKSLYFNPFATTVGEMALKQEHGHKPRESWRLSSLEPPKEKKQEQSQWERSVSDSAYTGGIYVLVCLYLRS